MTASIPSHWCVRSRKGSTFGWWLPGSFRKNGSRLAAWGAICLTIAMIIVVVVLIAGTSTAMAHLWNWPGMPTCVLTVLAFILVWKSARAARPRTGGGTGSSPADGLPNGKHAAP